MAILELYLGGFGQSTFNTAAFDTTLLGVPFKVASSNGDSIPIRPNAQNAGFVASAWTASGLPLGVTLVYKNGSWFFTGAPTQSGTFNILLTVTANGQQSIEGPFRVYVRNHPAHVAKNQTFSGKFNESFNGALAVLDPVNAPLGGLTWEVGTGITYGPNTWTENFSKWYGSSWVVNNLPPGLSLNQNTGTITGTPTKAGTFTPVISLVNNSGYRAPSEYASFTVQAGAPYIPNDQSVTTKYGNYFSKTFSVLDSANRPVTSWSSPDLPPGLTLNATTGALSGYINESNIALIQDRKRASYDPLYIGSFYVTLLAAGPGGTSSPTRIWLDVQYGTPKIIPAQIFNGTRGVAFSAAIAMDGDIYRPAYRWAATSPLPAGLILNPDTGAISGTPLNRESKTASLTATGDGGTGGTTVSFIIEAPYSAPIITAGQTFTGKVGSAFSATPAITDAIERPVTSWAGTALPSWATINATTGQITGTPSAIGAFNFELTATGPGGVSTGSISVTIGDRYSAPIIAAGQTFNGKVGSAFSATPALTDSANRPATNWSATGLPSWATLNATTGAITGTPQDIAGTTITLTATGSGGTSAATTAIIGIGLGAPNILAGQTFTGKVGEAFTSPLPSLEDPLDRPASSWAITGLPVGLVFNAPSGAITGTPTTKGTINANFVASGFAGTSAVTPVTFTISAGVPIIPAGQNATGKVGVPFSKKYTASDTDNRPVTSWASVSLPTWATLNSATGEVTGTPTTSGTFPISLTATGSGGTSSVAEFSIVTGNGAPLITPGQTFTGKVGEAFSATAALTDAASRPATMWGFGGLPAGLTPNYTTGEITGTPTTKGSFTANFAAIGSGGTSTQSTVTFTIAGGAPLIPAGQTLHGKVGAAFSVTPALTDSTNRPVNSWSATGLPAGLSINALTGEITGTPQDRATTTITLTASGTGGVGTATASLAIAAGTPVIVPGQKFTGKVGAAFSFTPSITDTLNFPATSWAASSLPTWATLNATTGTITGTPTKKGEAVVNLSASGAGGTSAVTPVTFTIAAAYPAPIITAGQSFTGKVGDVFPAITPALTDAAALPATSWSATSLPSGLEINATTGAITGTPTQSGAFSFSIAALSVEGESVESVAFTIAFGSPQIIPGQKLSIVQTEPFSAQLQGADESDRPISAWTSSDIPSWATLESDGRVHGTPPASGQFTFAVTATGPGGTDTDTVLLESSVEIPVIATTLVDVKVGVLHESFFTTTEPASMPVSFWGVTGTLPAGLSLDPTTGRLFGTPQAVGTSAVSTYAQNSAGKGSATISIVVAPGVPIVSAQEFYGAAGKDFDATLQAQDTTYRPASTWSIAPALPSGLALDTATGTITGNLTNPVRFSATLTATGAGGTASAALTIDIGAPIIAPIDAKVDFALDAVVAFTTATITSGRSKVESWTASSLPTGITFKDGVFLGRAQASGTYQITVTTQNKWDTSNAKVTFVVAQGAPIIAAGQKFSAKTDSKADFEVGLVNKSSRPATKWTAQGTLPRGLGLSQDGRISGTPSQNFTGTITLIAESPLGKSSASIAIAIKGPIFYGDKNPILQPGRVVKTFPSGLVMVSEVYKMRPINEAAARSRFAQGQTLVTSSTSSTALKIFPAPDFKSQDSGFVEMVVTAYGFTGADFRRTRKRMQSAKMLTKVLEVPEGGGAPTFQGKYSESNIQILANTHTITRAVAYATGVTPIAGAHGVSSLGGYTSVISPVTERYDVTAFGEVDEVTVTTAYEVTFTQQ